MEEEEMMMVSPTYKGNIWCTPQERLDWRLYLTELSDFPQNHIEAVDMIRTAGEEDTVEILITSPGGRVDIADMYLAAMKDTKARIITRAIGECASAATTIFLAGDERICEDGCYFMFHNPQIGGLGGDSANVFTRTKFYERLFKEKFHEQMAEILNKEEMSELFYRAGEIYLTASEMRDRLAASERKEEIRDTFDGGFLPPPEMLVNLPFPKTEVKEAEVFDEQDSFDITLDSGFKKTFSLSKLQEKDFYEYTFAELREVGYVFGLDLSGMSFEQAVRVLISDITRGGKD